jgi:hypothetical protein
MAGLQKVRPPPSPPAARVADTATALLHHRYSQFLPLKQTVDEENRGFVETVDFPGKTVFGPPTGEKVRRWMNRPTSTSPFV